MVVSDRVDGDWREPSRDGFILTKPSSSSGHVKDLEHTLRSASSASTSPTKPPASAAATSPTPPESTATPFPASPNSPLVQQNHHRPRRTAQRIVPDSPHHRPRPDQGPPHLGQAKRPVSVSVDRPTGAQLGGGRGASARRFPRPGLYIIEPGLVERSAQRRQASGQPLVVHRDQHSTTARTQNPMHFADFRPHRTLPETSRARFRSEIPSRVTYRDSFRSIT
jgi:hypothetical protein